MLAVVKKLPENGLEAAKINLPPFLCSLKNGTEQQTTQGVGGERSIKACSLITLSMTLVMENEI